MKNTPKATGIAIQLFETFELLSDCYETVTYPKVELAVMFRI